MTFVGRVRGGTGGGEKRSLLAPYPEWQCRCYDREPERFVLGGDLPQKTKPGWLRNCPDCKMRRP